MADDLQGAVVSGARLRASGLRTVVIDLDAPRLTAEAVVINVATRERAVISDETIQSPIDRVRRAARILCEDYRCRRLELRIDAALRRSYSLELQGFLEGAQLDAPVVLAVPAFPAAGRLTQGGRQLALVLDGESHEAPVGERLFGDVPTHVISLDVIDGGPPAVADEIRGRLDDVRHFVADATNEGHLRTLADGVALLEADHEVVTMSSGAWLRFHPAGERRNFVLVAMGLPTDTNERQLEQLLKAGRCRLATTEEALWLSTHREELAECLEANDTLIVRAPGESADDRGRLEAAAEVAHATDMLLAAAHHGGFACRGIVSTGAFTAARVASQLGAQVIHPVEEANPLCGFGVLANGAWNGLPLITKGGLVGNSETLVELVAHLSSRVDGAPAVGTPR